MRPFCMLLCLFALSAFFSCTDTIELIPNAFDNPNVQVISITNIEITPLGPIFRDLKVNFSVRTDLLSPQQNASISRYRVFENGNPVLTIGNENQHFFFRYDKRVGTTIEWEIAPMVGETEGPRSKVFVYVVE